MSEYRLRPHHALCISFFEGKGYSIEFVENMTAVIHRLNKGEDSNVQLTDKADIICSSCPNNKDGICSTESKVKGYDKSVLALCGLKTGQIIKWLDLKELADTKIIKANKLYAVCTHCQWLSICQEKCRIIQNGSKER